MTAISLTIAGGADTFYQPAVGQAGRRTSANYTNRRNDLCERVRAVQNKTLRLHDALKGLTIQAAVTLWDPGLLAKTESGWSGFHYDLMKELARRGDFYFEFHEHPFADDMGWSDWLKDTLDLYDVNAEYWMPTASRASFGAFPVFGFFDTSAQLVAHNKPLPSKLNWFSFLSPLKNEVWFALLGSTFLTALVYLISEWGENDEELNSEHHPAYGVISSLFHALWTITGAGTFEPKTWPGKIIAFSWAWCILLFVAAYTANLAAFLIVSPGSALYFGSMDEALNGGETICAWKGTAQHEVVEEIIAKTKPTYQGLRVTTKNPLVALLEGECDAAVLANIEVDIGSLTEEANPCCTLDKVGSQLTFTQGSWMVKNDYFEFCSILVRDVLFSLSSEAYNELFIDDLVAQYQKTHSDNHCGSAAVIEKRCPNGELPSGQTRRLSDQLVDSGKQFAKHRKLKGSKAKAGAAAGAAAAAEESSPEGTMGLEALAGIFLVHAACLLLGVSMAGLLKVNRRWKLRESGVSRPNADGTDKAVNQKQEEIDGSDIAKQLAEQRELILRLQDELLQQRKDQQSHQAELLQQQNDHKDEISAQLEVVRSKLGIFETPRVPISFPASIKQKA